MSGWDGLPQVCGDGHAQEGDCVVPLSCALLPVRDRVSAAIFLTHLSACLLRFISCA